MDTACSLARRAISLLAAIALAITSLTLPIAHSQSDSQDYEPPLIEHEVIDSADAAFAQEFTANVVDDKALAEVLLFYRFVGDEAFVSIPMTQVASSSVYTATVETDINDPKSIEYYIQARDEAGNRVVKGFAFNPLLRSIPDGNGAAPSSAANEPQASTGRRWLYIGLGVLAVGAIAAAAGSGGGRDSGTGGGEGDFTLILDPPQ